MLLFRSEDHVKLWCKVRGMVPRPIVTLPQLWTLAVAWYGNRLTVESRRPMGDEVRQIFEKTGLTGEFWSVQ